MNVTAHIAARPPYTVAGHLDAWDETGVTIDGRRHNGPAFLTTFSGPTASTGTGPETAGPGFPPVSRAGHNRH